MSHLLVIEFDDEASLKKLHSRIQEQTGKGKKFRVAGIFRSPDRWCGCPRPTGYHKDEVVRGTKLGWWVHRECRRAVMGQHTLQNTLEISEVSLPEREVIHRISSVGVFEVFTRNVTTSVS